MDVALPRLFLQSYKFADDTRLVCWIYVRSRDEVWFKFSCLSRFLAYTPSIRMTMQDASKRRSWESIRGELIKCGNLNKSATVGDSWSNREVFLSRSGLEDVMKHCRHPRLPMLRQWIKVLYDSLKVVSLDIPLNCKAITVRVKVNPGEPTHVRSESYVMSPITDPSTQVPTLLINPATPTPNEPQDVKMHTYAKPNEPRANEAQAALQMSEQLMAEQLESEQLESLESEQMESNQLNTELLDADQLLDELVAQIENERAKSEAEHIDVERLDTPDTAHQPHTTDITPAISYTVGLQPGTQAYTLTEQLSTGVTQTYTLPQQPQPPEQSNAQAYTPAPPIDQPLNDQPYDIQRLLCQERPQYDDDVWLGKPPSTPGIPNLPDAQLDDIMTNCPNLEEFDEVGSMSLDIDVGRFIDLSSSGGSDDEEVTKPLRDPFEFAMVPPESPVPESPRRKSPREKSPPPTNTRQGRIRKTKTSPAKKSKHLQVERLQAQLLEAYGEIKEKDAYIKRQAKEIEDLNRQIEIKQTAINTHRLENSDLSHNLERARDLLDVLCAQNRDLLSSNSQLDAELTRTRDENYQLQKLATMNCDILPTDFQINELLQSLS